MEAPKRKLNPLVAAAAVAVIVVAGVAVAAFTGALPGTGASAPDAKATPRANVPEAMPRIATRTGKCLDCGVVLGVLQVTEKGEGTGVGAVAGGVGGAVVGNQFGDDSQDRLLGRVVGAVGGAVAGHEIERQARRTKRWEVTVSMQDGSHKVVTYFERPEWKAGDRVRVASGRIVGVANPG